ncbi:MAG: class I SAM-dependent methyltransferase [Deltaproteobacteria bacterium]|nr:class I SAM-dependent methyltransferase [Deltaproteobacteria bacterium]MBW2227465.1 class I SAM-dependent methyltransferase [Deltaproteobacteria bacterium]MBW2327786.1 class I SAM-dependent methyltransferase [Deltaproteobacteria bacterium]
MESIKHMKRSIFMPFKRDRKKHWERVYKKNKPGELGWYQDCPEMSLKFITATGVGVNGNIIDVGGGTSKLAGILLDQGYMKLTVLDISGSSIEKAKLQHGEKSKQITWIEADVTKFNFIESFDIWHDRAVFHFLTDAIDRRRYVDSLNQALKPGGHLIISTFGLKAPPKCSGLKVVRYSAATLHNEFGDNFLMAETFDEVHDTPSKVQQNFIYCRFTKRT